MLGTQILLHKKSSGLKAGHTSFTLTHPSRYIFESPISLKPAENFGLTGSQTWDLLSVICFPKECGTNYCRTCNTLQKVSYRTTKEQKHPEFGEVLEVLTGSVSTAEALPLLCYCTAPKTQMSDLPLMMHSVNKWFLESIFLHTLWV